MNYENFNTYPLQILGIDESYDDELNAILEFVIDEIAYTGDVDDLSMLLPYFVFFRFCENKQSEVVANVGETMTVKEFTIPSQNKMIDVWNIGVNKLLLLCKNNTTSANWIYLTELNIWGI